MPNDFVKDPRGFLDYGWDWSDWLQNGELIASAEITIPDGIVQEEVIVGETGVLIWLSGGTDGIVYKIDCKIVTDHVPPRTDSRFIEVFVKDR